MSSDFPFTLEEFQEIYSKVPRLTVEVLLKSDRCVFLTKRDIEPFKGTWHLPGGTVYVAESLENAVERIAKRELGINVIDAKQVGVIEYPSHYKNGYDTPVGIVYEVTIYEGQPATNHEAADGLWFSSVPKNIHGDQDDFLTKHNYLAS
jgi:ADP-ribose pyrophosphatase YjhB (NUDIX family)